MLARLQASGPRAVIFNGQQIARTNVVPTPSVSSSKQAEVVGTPPAVAAASPAPAATDRSIRAPFSFGDATPMALGTVSGVFFAASIAIADAFNGTGAALSIGTQASPELLMPADANAPAEAGRYEFSGAVELENAPIFLFITPGFGATQGGGVVFLERS